MYVYVNNGVVEKERGCLPLSWKNISGFNNLSDEEVKAHGWFKVVDEIPTVKDYEFYMDDGYNVSGSEVRVNYVIHTLSLEEYKSQRISDLKSNATAKILQDAPEYKQRSAALGLYDEAKTNEIKNTISNIINQVNTVEEQILSAADYDSVTDINIEFGDV